MKSDLIDLEVALHYETDMAYRVSLTGDDEDAVWVPKSGCELDKNFPSGACLLSLKEQLAIDKGLV